MPIASVLYLLSAGCVLYGVGQILGPLMGQTEAARDKLFCIGALNGYELALLGVALLVLLWKEVTEDVVALAVLLGAFLIGSAAALDSVAVGHPRLTLGLALAAALLAGGKLWAATRYVLRGWDLPSVIALAAVLLVSLAAPVTLSWRFGSGVIRTELEPMWWLGLTAALAAGFALLAALWLTPTGDLRPRPELPYLYSRSMWWVFLLIVLAGALGQQRALSWAFNLHFPAACLLGFFTLATVLALELLRGHGVTHKGLLLTIAMAPVLVLVVTLSSRNYPLPGSWSSWAAYPPALLLVLSVPLGILGLRLKQLSMTGLAVMVLLLGVWVWGITPEKVQFAPQFRLTLTVASLLMLAALLLTGHQAWTLLLGVLLACQAFFWPFVGWAASLQQPAWILPAALLGMGLLGAAAWRPRLHGALVWSGSLLLCLTVAYNTFGADSRLWPLVASMVLLVMLGALAWRCRRWALPAPALLLALLNVGTGGHFNSAWLSVLLGFVMLGAGAAASILLSPQRRARAAASANETTLWSLTKEL